jgi:hypothetical protein
MAKASGDTPVDKLILAWIRLITEDQRYYFVKAIDLFYELPDLHQKNLIEFFGEKAENESWTEAASDNTKYIDVIRNILFYYSGKEKVQQPNKNAFASILGEYLKSDRCKEAHEVRIKKKKDFQEGLKSL